MIGWKKTWEGEKSDGSKTYSFDSEDYVINIFSMDGGDKYYIRKLKLDHTYDVYDHKVISTKKVKGISQALKEADKMMKKVTK